MSPFSGFSAGDFDAFAEKKWASNAYNRERLEVKLALTGMGNTIHEVLEDELTGLEMGISEERPSIFNQHRVDHLTLFFYRDAPARKALGSIIDKAKSIADNVLDPAPHHKHISLALRVDCQTVQFGLFLHRDAWIDWKNAIERCSAYGELDRLNGLLAELPPEVVYGSGTGLSQADAPASTVDAQKLLDGFGEAEPWTILGASFGRADEMVATDMLVDRTVEVFSALLPVFRFAAWSRENDFHEMKEVIKEHQEKVQRKFTSLDVGDKVRVVGGLAAGRLGIVDSVEKKGIVKVRMGLLVMAVQMDDLARP